MPLKLKKRPERLRAACSTTKWPSKRIDWARVSRELSRFRCPPACLHHSDLRVCEVVDQRPREVGGGDEVGVEDGDELSLGTREPKRQGPRLVPGSIAAA